jgi:hypothetical protein
MKRLGILLFCAVSAYAGKSMTLHGNYLFNGSVPSGNKALPFRHEFVLHDWPTNPTTSQNIINATFNGVNAVYTSSSPAGMQMYTLWDTSGPIFNVPLTAAAGGPSDKWLTIRIQRDPAGVCGAPKTTYLEAWDRFGTRLLNRSGSYASDAAYAFNGLQFGAGRTEETSIAWYRVHSTLICPGTGQMPVTFNNTAVVYQWRFDNAGSTGSLAESVGGTYNLSTSDSASVSNCPGSITTSCYADTPFQANPIVAIKAGNIPTQDASWAQWVSLLVGASNTVDASGSFSQADTSSVVTCAWSSSGGPSSLVFANTSNCTTTVTGVGATNTGTTTDYTLSMTVTDAASNMGTGTLEVGAVAADANGVVTGLPTPVTQIFRSMIAFGQNPWGYADERAKRAVDLQIANVTPNTFWTTTGVGTVSYIFSGQGVGPGATCTTLSAAIASTAATTVHITDVTCLQASMASLPSWIMIGNCIGVAGCTGQELVRISACVVDATSMPCTGSSTGAATLTVAYDGRGIASNGYVVNTSQVGPAQTWANGTKVGDYRVYGSSTLFGSDSSRPLCPAGLPGPMGPIVYSTGLAALAASSTTITGSSGASWTVGNNVIAGDSIRISGTHGGGTPFAWWAVIITVTDATHLVASRAAPSDVDATPVSYHIVGAIYPYLEMQDTDGTYRALEGGLGCESETAAFFSTQHDITHFNTQWQSGVKYGYAKSLGEQSAFGDNFYGSGLAARAFFFRSGYVPALTWANLIDENWVRGPELCSGWCGGDPLLQGGGVVGAFADKATNASTVVAFSDLRHFGESGNLGSQPCNAWDARDSGYLTSYPNLLGLFDVSQEAHWVGYQQANLTREQNCKRNSSDGYTGAQINSWANTSAFNPGYSTALSLTNNSKTVTGTGFNAANSGNSPLCLGTWVGTITVTNGSPNFTVASTSKGAYAAGPGGSARINVNDTTTPLAAGYEYHFVDSTHGIMAATWPGASGTFDALTEVLGAPVGNSQHAVIWNDASESFANNQALSKFWACYPDSDTQFSLFRPWDGATNTNYHLYMYVVAGFEQQPFMMGVHGRSMQWGSDSSDATTSSGNLALLPLLGGWMAAHGVDTNSPGTLGTAYEAVSTLCTEDAPNATTLFQTVHGATGACGAMGLGAADGAGNGEFVTRVNTAEAMAGLIEYYLDALNRLGYSDPTTAARRAFVDKYYGGIFGNCAMTSGGGSTFYCDSHYVNTAGELSDASLSAYKWPGFFFGMGMAHQWPAMRLLSQPALISSSPGFHGPVSIRGAVGLR